MATWVNLYHSLTIYFKDLSKHLFDWAQDTLYNYSLMCQVIYIRHVVCISIASAVITVCGDHPSVSLTQCVNTGGCKHFSSAWYTQRTISSACTCCFEHQQGEESVFKFRRDFCLQAASLREEEESRRNTEYQVNTSTWLDFTEAVFHGFLWADIHHQL